MNHDMQFWSIGECMLELRQGGENVLHTSAAGDTYNTAVYLKRLLPALTVAYVSALGDDAMSGSIRAQMRGHGIDDRLLDTLPGQLPGLYLIETDEGGERRFRYWREQSAARSMLGAVHLERLYAALPTCGALLLTGITLAILDDPRRAALLELAARVRAQGGWVVLDSNYRPALWQADVARHWLAQALKISSHALLSADDEALLHGDADPAATLARVLRAGEAEVVIKMGAQGCLLGGAGLPVLEVAATPVTAVDTTAAGDSFNAGYLAARWVGHAPEAAAKLGGGLAAAVVAHAGAIVPQSAMAQTLMDIQL
ncbi:sugar kinase [Janthinobacterium sp. HLX7-2]|uniref:sugar kinase n=1 Tax=Janthinobacterium sp. HLX7-2 TaxID=1259331 RepID=UPI003F269520